MNKHLFKGILLGVILSLLLTVSVSAIAQGNDGSSLMKVYHSISGIKVNGYDMHLDVQPFIHNRRTYIPLRAVSEYLGYDVGWNNTTKNITINNHLPKPSLPFNNEIILSNGNYVAGKHFKAGIYDIIAVKGNGTVGSSNSYSGGISAMMGVSSNDYYQKEYKNINLPEGEGLTLRDVTVKLVFKE